MYWLREIAGWLLILVGLWLFYLSYFVWVKSGKPIQAGPSVIMGMVIFRGGIHLLKVAVAARVCRQAPTEERAKPVALTVGRPQRPKTVIPGRRESQ
jgi:hypothetical protein